MEYKQRKMNFIKNIFIKPKSNTQSINVVKYPNQFVFETYYRIKNSYSIRSKEISVLACDASTVDLGKAIIKHLSLSKVITKISEEERKSNDEYYKEITGLKSIKIQMNEALQVHISRNNHQIEFYATVNGGTTGDKKGFHFTDNNIIIEDNGNYEMIGETLLLTFEKSK